MFRSLDVSQQNEIPIYRQTRETVEGFDGISLRRFWKGDEDDDRGGGGGSGDGDGGGLFRVSMSEKMCVMARWFPAPPRKDLI